MSYGVNILGSNGNYQIQDGVSTFLVKSSGTVASGTVFNLNYHNPSAGEFLLLRPASNTGWIALGRNGSRQTSMLCSSGNIVYAVAAPSNTVSQSSDTYGLRIKNSSGGLIFDSGAKYPLPVANGFLPNTETAPNYRPTASLTVTSPIAGRSRYLEYSFVNPVGIEPYGPNASYWLYPRCYWNSATSFSFDVRTEVGAPPAPYPWYYPANRYFFLLEF